LAERSGFASLPQPATGLAASANTLRAPSRSGHPSGSDPPEVPAESDVRRRPASDKERRVGGSAHLSPVVAPPPRCAAVPRSSLSQLLPVRQGSGFSGIPVRLPISPGSAPWQMESRPELLIHLKFLLASVTPAAWACLGLAPGAPAPLTKGVPCTWYIGKVHSWWATKTPRRPILSPRTDRTCRKGEEKPAAHRVL